MVEFQSCSTLVSTDSALCTIEQDVKGDTASVAEISAELKRERQKNAELMERISMLEAQISQRNTETQENHQYEAARSLKNFKRQKIERVDDEIENMNIVKSQIVSQYMSDTEGIAPKEINPANLSISWMSMDDSQDLHREKIKNRKAVANFNQTDNDDACDDNYDDEMYHGDNRQRHEEIDDITEIVREEKGYFADHIDEESNIISFSGHMSDPTGNVKQEDHEQKTSCMLLSALSEKNEVKSDQGTEIKETAELEVPSSGSVHISQNRKSLKVAFCPKEVKRLIESEALEQKNAQCHTMKKIIVFATLGTRHGCEDMYELDFNHFSILKKGEPYVSPRNPGEHVLYENPGVQRKIFYPNRQNPVLCPVQILEEERSMRPSDPSCPSCLFLCIKYGGRTRNLPQNEYVRQRMGRNKLKSFGPLMCRMAMLVHIRSGSFFFKALGITLLFMAGFPDDLVQRETKYQNLDLLQKYYRTDEDAEGDELFLPYPITFNHDTHEPQSLTKRTLPTKSRGRKHDKAIIKSHHNSQMTPSQPSPPISSASTQFGLTGYSSAHTYVMAAFHSVPSQSSQNIHMPNPSSYPMLPPQPSSAFVPVMYWPPPNAFLHGPYPSTYACQSFPSTANYTSIQTQPYYNNHPSSSSFPKLLLEGNAKNDPASEESENDSNSSSSAT